MNAPDRVLCSYYAQRDGATHQRKRRGMALEDLLPRLSQSLASTSDQSRHQVQTRVVKKPRLEISCSFREIAIYPLYNSRFRNDKSTKIGNLHDQSRAGANMNALFSGTADVFVHEQSELLCIVVQHVAVWASCEQLGLVTSNLQGTACKAASRHH